MEKISWTDRVRNEEMLHRVKEERNIIHTVKTNGGRDSSVGIETSYGLNGPGIESRWVRDFSHTSRPTQPSVQWVPGLSRG
jgi:hypothetical protein